MHDAARPKTDGGFELPPGCTCGGRHGIKREKQCGACFKAEAAVTSRRDALMRVKSLLALGLSVQNFEGLKVAEAERLLRELGVEIT